MIWYIWDGKAHLFTYLVGMGTIRMECTQRHLHVNRSKLRRATKADQQCESCVALSVAERLRDEDEIFF